MMISSLVPKAIQRAAVLGALLVSLAAPATATQISVAMTVDNNFSIYLSTNDSVQGTLFGSGNNWPDTYNFNATLTSGVTNYLHIRTGDEGGIAALIAQLTLSDSQFKFGNGTQSLLSGTSYWSGSLTGFGSNYQTPIDLGPNGVGPWGLRPGIDSAARFIWVQDAQNVNTAYFTVAIQSNAPANVPDSATTVTLVGLSLAGLIAARRKFGRN